jgi:hypothetical protein
VKARTPNSIRHTEIAISYGTDTRYLRLRRGNHSEYRRFSSSIGAVLSQILDGKERVIAYASRTMNDSERRYSVTKRELLAVLYALKQFRHYLLACPSFTIRTDHAPLVHVQQMKNPSTHIARWSEYMQEYNFTVIHRQGRLHGNADGQANVMIKILLYLPATTTQ